MFKKLRLENLPAIKRIKNYFSELFSPEKRERGVAPILLWIGAPIVKWAVTAGALYLGWKIFGSEATSGVAVEFSKALGALLVSISFAFLGAASDFLTYVLSPAFTLEISDVAKNMVFVQAWASVRDLTNMLIVLAFVAVGIATTLRIKEYEAKNLLFKLILLALLINFSGLLCGTIIKGADITQTALLSAGSASSNFGALATTMTDTWNRILESENETVSKPRDIIGLAAGVSIIALFLGWIYFILAVLLAARYAVLAVLYILSPIAFFCFVFPAAKGLWNKWWKEFLGWSFLGVTSAFFIYLGMNVIYLTSGNIGPKDLFVSIIFFYVGYRMARYSSAAGAGAIIGLAAGAATMAMGGVTKLAGGAAALAGKGALGAAGLAADKTGLKGAALGAKDWASQHLENMGLMDPGKTSMNQQSRLNDKDRMNRINSMTAEDMVRELENPRRGSNSRLDRAAMTKKLSENNQLGMVANPARRQELITDAINSGIRSKDLIGGMSSSEIANILDTQQYDEETRAKGTKALMERGDLYRITNPDTQRRIVTEGGRHGIRMGELAKADYHFRRYDNGPDGEVTRLGNEAEALREQISANMPNMSGAQRRGIDAGDLATPDGYDMMVSRMTGDMLKDYRTSLPAYRARVFGTGGTLNSDLVTAIGNARTRYAGNTRKLNEIQAFEAEALRLAN